MHVLKHTSLAYFTPFHLPPSPTQNTAVMVSLEGVQANPRSIETISSPRISFSADFLDEKNFICINPNHEPKRVHNERENILNLDFEFLSNDSATDTMLTADELFYEGKLLPCWQMQHSEKLNKISLKPKEDREEEVKKVEKEEATVNWFLDDDPSPRPPKCTVLWKELLRLRKQRASSLSPSSSSSASSSSSLADISSTEEGKEGKEGMWNREKHVKRIKKGLERTRSASVRIKPLINVPICTHGKSSTLPPLFSLKKGHVVR